MMSASVQYGLADCYTDTENRTCEFSSVNEKVQSVYDGGVHTYYLSYSRKVFLGGLPPDIDEDGIKEAFWKFGSLEVFWPGKYHNPTNMFPPKGYAFLQFKAEDFVHRLVQGCIRVSDGGLYYLISSPSVKNKVIQVKPWRLEDSATIVDESFFSVKQFAMFVGGIPRTLTSAELARQASNVFGKVTYTEIFLDYKMNYPKGSGVVCFSSFESFVSAITCKYLKVLVEGSVKHVELKPYFNRW